MEPTFTAIVATAENRAIGMNGKIPWHLPEDLQFFKDTTSGHAMIMGRKTWQSIGRALPNRTSIILSRTLNPAKAPGAIVARNLDEAIDAVPYGKKAFIIGGEEIYRLAWPDTKELIISHVKGTPEADAFFPVWEKEFTEAETLLETKDFVTKRWLRSSPLTKPPYAVKL